MFDCDVSRDATLILSNVNTGLNIMVISTSCKTTQPPSPKNTPVPSGLHLTLSGTVDCSGPVYIRVIRCNLRNHQYLPPGLDTICCSQRLNKSRGVYAIKLYSAAQRTVPAISAYYKS
ncbi:hypothetical protein RRG08_011410 [Elysia crispata]|uniref:Uncharacterized protein n=1 Tax=Elysia crispata TaxID=231223 RepID=A0AAE1AXJ3_9GAST|nr:hypothetical protein RRG08_011410 [Elysia crispata]